MVKRRAPGGGRKPKSPRERKGIQLQLRIDDSLRATLEAQGRVSGGMSAVALRWLGEGYHAERERKRDKRMRALCYVIAEIASTVCSFKYEGDTPALDWRTNPFAFETLKLVIIKFLDEIKPKGKIKSPAKEYPVLEDHLNPWGPHSTPTKRADDVAEIILHNFFNAKQFDVEKMFGVGLDDKTRASLQHAVYGMSDAQKDLLISGSAR